MDVCGYVKNTGKQLGSDPMPPKDSVRDTLKFLVEKLVMCPQAHSSGGQGLGPQRLGA